MLKIRLSRIGRKHDPHYRLVVVESHRAPRSGKSIEILGSYNPRGKQVKIKKDRVEYWVSKGAQLSGTARDLLRRNGDLQK